MYDLCVIGAGASGTSAAITAAKAGKRVILIDKNNKLGRKLYATGNGRCNITNKEIIYKNHYNSSYPEFDEFLCSSLGDAPYIDMINFCEEIGVVTKEINNYVYPASLQASAFVWALIDSLNKYGVKILLKAPISEITKEEDIFIIKTEKEQIKAVKLLLACGSNSYESLGGSNSGYEICRSFNHNIINVRPALCGLITKEDTTEISGVRALCNATLLCEGNIIASEAGELQITEYGLSGIMIFNLSSKCTRLIGDEKNAYISIDFLNQYDNEYIKKLINNAPNRTVLGCFNTLLNDKLAAYIINRCGINPKTKCDDISQKDILRLIKQFKNMIFNIAEVKDFDSAQVCSGGVSLAEINPDFSSKLINNLYITGELLDIDGKCGGYNITFAILSGIRAGKSI